MSQGTNWEINLRLPTVSTKLPLSALTSRDNSICFPRINWRTNELGQRGLGTPWAELSSSPSFRALRAFDWHVPRRPLRRDGESSLWNQLWRLAHHQRLKPFVVGVWGTHDRRKYKSIEINLWGDQRFEIRLWGDQELWVDKLFWIASSANSTPCHVYIRHCIWESTSVKRIQDFYLAATMTVETINVHESFWNYSVSNDQ